MSVCASVKTEKKFEPQALFKKLADSGERIVVTSGEFPTLTLGECNEAIRGIEVIQEGDGFEVRVCAMASIADYRLFGLVIDAVVELTHGVFYDEDDDEHPVGKKAADFYDSAWIKFQRESSLSLVKAMVANSGEAVVMSGLMAPFCIGAGFLHDLGVDLYGKYKVSEADRLEEHLCYMQWLLANKTDTSTRIVLPNPENPKEGKTVSLISIKDGKVAPFDYISYADLLCIIDYDGDTCPVFLHFRELWKILSGDGIYQRLDEYQYVLTGKLTPRIVRMMMDNARRLQSQNLHKRPVFPGFGFDEEQHTVVLMWNPAFSSVTMDDHNQTIPRMLREYYNWSVWEYDKAKIGDRFYLVRCGQGRTGIVMSGIFDSNPYELEDWSGKGRQTFYMDMIPNVILNPEQAPMITTEELEREIPTFGWKGGHSGRLLTQDEAQALERLWAKFIEDHTADIDHKTLNMTILH